MEFWDIALLVVSGSLVGFINTLSGSATVISIAVLTMMGLPINVANGTHRVAVLFQNAIAIRGFHKKGMLDTSKAWKFAIPTTLGSIIGAFIAVEIDKYWLEKSVAIVMVVMLLMLIFKPERWLKGNEEKRLKKTNFFQYIAYFLMGIYGGFIHIGVGIFMLAMLVLSSGYDLLRANAIKNFMVFLYVPFALSVFIINGMVVWEYALIHATGNMLGAWIATRYALDKGNQFVRWLLVGVLTFAILHFFGILKGIGL